jgi:hypothetical protein
MYVPLIFIEKWELLQIRALRTVEMLWQRAIYYFPSAGIPSGLAPSIVNVVFDFDHYSSAL